MLDVGTFNLALIVECSSIRNERIAVGHLLGKRIHHYPRISGRHKVVSEEKFRGQHAPRKKRPPIPVPRGRAVPDALHADQFAQTALAQP